MHTQHAPLTRRHRARPSPAIDTDTPLQDWLLSTLQQSERALTRCAQDERDIEALIKLRAAMTALTLPRN